MENITDIYAKAAAELSSVDAQIAALEKRRIALRQFVELGRQLYAGHGHAQITLPAVQLDASGTSTPPNKFIRFQNARESSMKARILALSREALSKAPYLHTVQLIDYIEQHGVAVTGANKSTTVSVILSRDHDFVSDRTRGWSLVKKNPQDVAASAGSSTA